MPTTLPLYYAAVAGVPGTVAELASTRLFFPCASSQVYVIGPAAPLVRTGDVAPAMLGYLALDIEMRLRQQAGGRP